MSARRVVRGSTCGASHRGAPHGRVLLAAVLLGAGLMSWPHPTQAQVRAEPVELEGITDQRTRAALLATVREAGEQGVPVELLHAKIREGIAKQSPPERIAEAVTQLAARLATARRALAPVRSTDEIAAGAGALQQGVPVAALRQLREVRPAQPLTVPLGVVTELVASGVSAPRATGRVRDLLKRGATNAQLVELSRSVQRDVAEGRVVSNALDLHAKRALALLATPPKTTLTGPAPIRP